MTTPDMYIEFNTDGSQTPSVRTVKEGVYYYNERPIYLVNLVEDSSDPYVLVFGIQDTSDTEHLVKAYHEEEVLAPRKFSRATELSRIAAQKKVNDSPSQIKKVKVVNPPLFVSPCIEGEDTFTGETSLGFNDRTPERETADSVPTGVFITLGTIRWIRSFIPRESFMEYFQLRKNSYLNGIENTARRLHNGF